MKLLNLRYLLFVMIYALQFSQVSTYHRCLIFTNTHVIRNI